MSKESSYQKLKRENTELKLNIQELVLRPESLAATTIRTKVVVEAKIEEAMWNGNSKVLSGNFRGLLPYILNQ